MQYYSKKKKENKIHYNKIYFRTIQFKIVLRIWYGKLKRKLEPYTTIKQNTKTYQDISRKKQIIIMCMHMYIYMNEKPKYHNKT